MIGKTNPFARRLRIDSTEVERLLWQRLRNRQLGGNKFRRQVTIGPFIVDFACIDACLIVEIDGGQHSEERDAARTAFLQSKGYRVIRFWNNEVLTELAGVHQMLQAVLAGYEPSPGWRFSPATLSPTGRGDDSESTAK